MNKKYLFYTITIGALIALGFGMFSINVDAKSAVPETSQKEKQYDGAERWHNSDCYDEHKMAEGHSHTQDCYDEQGRLKETRTRLDSDDSGKSPRSSRRGMHMRGNRNMRSGRGGCH